MPIPPLNKWVVRALYAAGGFVLNLWLMAAHPDSSEKDEYQTSRRRAPRQQAPAPTEELKLVLVVNDSLKMGKGKIGMFLLKYCDDLNKRWLLTL